MIDIGNGDPVTLTKALISCRSVTPQIQIKHFLSGNFFVFKLNFLPRLLLGFKDNFFEINLPIQ